MLRFPNKISLTLHSSVLVVLTVRLSSRRLALKRVSAFFESIRERFDLIPALILLVELTFLSLRRCRCREVSTFAHLPRRWVSVLVRRFVVFARKLVGILLAYTFTTLC